MVCSVRLATECLNVDQTTDSVCYSPYKKKLKHVDLVQKVI